MHSSTWVDLHLSAELKRAPKCCSASVGMSSPHSSGVPPKHDPLCRSWHMCCLFTAWSQRDVPEEAFFSFMMVSRSSVPPTAEKLHTCCFGEIFWFRFFFSVHKKCLVSLKSCHGLETAHDLNPEKICAHSEVCPGQKADVLDYNKHLNCWVGG